MTKRVNIVLPAQTLSILDQVATKGSRSRFISNAIHFYVESHGKQNLRDQLKAGYLANAERDLAIAAEWFPLEEEANRRLDHPVRKTTTKTKSNEPPDSRPDLSGPL